MAIIASSDDAIISKDLNGIVSSWNEGARRIFGYEAEEMIGQRSYVLFLTSYTTRKISFWRKSAQGCRGTPFDCDRGKEGPALSCAASVSRIFPSVSAHSSRLHSGWQRA
jgi:PAS domain S-box-containing protein